MRYLAPQSRLNIPIALSKVSAGPASDFCEDYHLLDVCSLITQGREGYFACEVTGESALPIVPGTIVFGFAYAEPRFGELVIIEVDGLVCLKKFEHSRKGLYLASNNGEQFPPIEITAENDIRILGVYRGHLQLSDR